MGYVVWWELEIQPNPETLTKAEKLEAKLCGDWTLEQHRQAVAWPEESCSWYDMDVTMSKHSERHPDILFIVTADGEESDDFARYFFKNGRSYSVAGEIVYPPFDESMLE